MDTGMCSVDQQPQPQPQTQPIMYTYMCVSFKVSLLYSKGRLQQLSLRGFST